MAFATSARPIENAVATAGLNERVAFLRRTYAHLGAALMLWAGLTWFIFTKMTATSFSFSKFALQGRGSWFVIILLFMGINFGAQLLARNANSRGLQYAGLALGAVGEALILQPMLWVLFVKYGGGKYIAEIDMNHVSLAGPAATILGQATVITLVIFGGLTATVFISKKDFSFMRGALVLCTAAFAAVALASLLFGFQLGGLYCGLGVLLMAGYILFQTSQIMKDFPITQHVAAALMLFGTIATLFWYVLQLLMSRRD